MRVSVVGGGSWGTALGHHLSRLGHQVLLWALEEEVAEGINKKHRNPLFVNDLDLDPHLEATTELLAVARHSSVWVWVVPVQFSRGVMGELADVRPENLMLVSASKGIERQTLHRMDELAEELLNLPREHFGCLAGPTFAREVIQGQPSAGVLAFHSLETAVELQHEFSDHHLRFYSSQDLVGVEVAAALKNVIAIAAGILDGLGLGTNTQAALLTRGLHEITRLGVRLGADPDTFRGLAGMGDLVLTSTGTLSRNRRVGRRLGQGEGLDDILASSREVAEGVLTTPAAAGLAAGIGIEMPITQAMTAVLAGEVDPHTAIRELMLRDLKGEADL